MKATDMNMDSEIEPNGAASSWPVRSRRLHALEHKGPSRLLHHGPAVRRTNASIETLHALDERCS